MSVKKNNLIMLVVAMALLTVAAFKVSNAESTSNQEKSVAWYVANAKEAHEQNKECYDNPSLQSTPNCVNSLHALELKFAGGNGNGRR